MAAKIYKRINYKSDFLATLQSDAGWTTPFCIKFWTGAPSQAYFVGYDGTTYTHCAPVTGEPTKLAVQFDNHHLPCGELKYQVGYHFTVDDFPEDTEDEVINQADVILTIDGEQYYVLLDFNGETSPEIMFSLPAYANEAQRVANEAQRIANEEARVAAEQERVEEFNAAEERIGVIISEGDAAVAAANAAAINANAKASEAELAAQSARDAASDADSAASDARIAADGAESAAQSAGIAAASANNAAQSAQQQAAGAGKVNAQLSGTVITITDRNGVASSIDVMDTIAEFVNDVNSVLDMINGEVI